MVSLHFAEEVGGGIWKRGGGRRFLHDESLDGKTSLAGKVTSSIFVATKKKEKKKVFCLDKIMLVATKNFLSRRNIFRVFVATKRL